MAALTTKNYFIFQAACGAAELLTNLDIKCDTLWLLLHDDWKHADKQFLLLVHLVPTSTILKWEEEQSEDFLVPDYNECIGGKLQSWPKINSIKWLL